MQVTVCLKANLVNQLRQSLSSKFSVLSETELYFKGQLHCMCFIVFCEMFVPEILGKPSVVHLNVITIWQPVCRPWQPKADSW